jgi:hypothetical protein
VSGVGTFARSLQQAILDLAEGEPGGGLRSAREEVQRFERAIAAVGGAWIGNDATAPWAEELGVELPCDRQDVVRAFRRLAFRTHPDRAGGSHERFLRAQALLQEALDWLHTTAAKGLAERFRRAPARAASQSVVA